MNNVIKTFEDGSELTPLKLAGAVIVGAIGGTLLFLATESRENRKYKKIRKNYITQAPRQIIDIKS